MNIPARFPVVGLATDPGNIRDNNEDFYYVTPNLTPEQAAAKGYLYFVADGVGGHQSGEVASQLAAEVVPQVYYQDPNPDIGVCLGNAVAEANRRIYHQGISSPEQYGMGTTFSGIALRGNEVYVANVGDSRTYLIRGGQISQLSIDHTWVQEKVQAGILSPQEAANHPQKNVITRSLGGELQVGVDVFPPRPVAEGDVFLMCSDGLSDLVNPQEIAAVVGQNADLNAAAQQFVAIAKQRGAPDNVTVLLVSVGQRRGGIAAARPPAAPRTGRHFPIMPVLAVVLLALAAVLAYVFLRPEPGPTTPGTLRPTRTPTGEVVQETPAAPVEGIPVDIGPPSLTGPADGTEFQPGETFALTWGDNLPDGLYRYQVEVKGPDDVVMELSLNGVPQHNTASFTVTLGEQWAEGTYKWIVRAQQQDDSGWRTVNTSEPWTFMVAVQVLPTSTPGPTPAPPTPAPACVPQPPASLMPANLSTQYFGNPVTFTWDGGSLCPGQRWVVMFDNDKMPCPPTTSNTAACAFPTRAEGWYTWHLAVVNEAGTVLTTGTSISVEVYLKEAPGSGGVCKPPEGGCPDEQVWNQEQCQCVRR